MTLLCVPILVHDVAHALADAARAKQGGADLVELRIDEFFTGEGLEDAGPTDPPQVAAIVELVQRCPLPCIVTCRASAEGGGYDGPDDARVSLLERLGTLPTPPYAIDVEWSTFQRSANLRQKVKLAVQHPSQLREGVRTQLVLSLHDFRTRPPDLLRRLADMASQPAARVLKVALRARNLSDTLELLDLPGHTSLPTIALGMGDFGVASRILAPKFGGWLTFASLHSAGATAPGQPTLEELLDVYRFRALRPSTRVYGIVGHPVSRSLSPAVHNAAFGAHAVDGVYVPLPIAAFEGEADASYLHFKAQMLELIEHPRLDLAGVSVTMPHKEHLLRLAREQGWRIDAASAAIGAANTLAISPARTHAGDRASVHNTDADACADALIGVLGSLAGKRVAVVGAGGMGAAAAIACAQRGATVVLFARDGEKAKALADRLTPHLPASGAGRIVPAAMTLLARTCCDALVQCTPVGMADGPSPAGSIVPVAEMGACPTDMVVMETITSPRTTPLLAAARARGWRTIDGVAMFVRQAAVQSRLWTGRDVPEGLFERVVEEELARRARAASGPAA